MSKLNVLLETIEKIPAEFYTKDVSNHLDMISTHPEEVEHGHYNSFVGKVMERLSNRLLKSKLTEVSKRVADGINLDINFSSLCRYVIFWVNNKRCVESCKKEECLIVEIIPSKLTAPKSHVHNILEKLSLDTRVQIAKHAYISDSFKIAVDTT